LSGLARSDTIRSLLLMVSLIASSSLRRWPLSLSLSLLSLSLSHTAAAAAANATETPQAAAPAEHTTPTPAESTDGDDAAMLAAAAAGALVHLSCDGDFRMNVAAIRMLASIADLQAFIEQCQQREGAVRTPLVLLQLIALMRQFECMSPLASTSQSELFGRRMDAHGQPSDTAAARIMNARLCPCSIVRPHASHPGVLLFAVYRSLFVLLTRVSSSMERSTRVSTMEDGTTNIKGTSDGGQQQQRPRPYMRCVHSCG
jgi:hypothetical protein